MTYRGRGIKATVFALRTRRGGGGVKIWQQFAYVLYGWPPINESDMIQPTPFLPAGQFGSSLAPFLFRRLFNAFATKNLHVLVSLVLFFSIPTFYK